MYFIPCCNTSVVDFEQVNTGWHVIAQRVKITDEEIRFRKSHYSRKFQREIKR